MDCRCDYCGKCGSDMMPSFWKDRTRWFCDLNCIQRFKVLAIGRDYDELVLEGEPGAAKSLFEKLNTEGGEDNCKRTALFGRRKG